MTSAAECEREETTPRVRALAHESADWKGRQSTWHALPTGSEMCQPNAREVCDSHHLNSVCSQTLTVQ